MPLKSTLLGAVMIAAWGLLATSAQGAPILVAGPSPVAPFGGTVIDFEGLAEGTLIDTEYSGMGVTFTQDDGGTPMIDNLPALFGYGPGSGTGMLTGSTTGGAQFPTVAGLVAEFSTPQAQVGAFLSDAAPLGDYTISAFGAGGVLLESFVVAGASFPNCGTSFPVAPGCGVFAGFDRVTADILSVQWGPSAAFGDSFAIDDVRFTGSTVPEPATLTLFGLTAVGIAAARRRRAIPRR
jgi:hypothetical protein